MARGTEKTVDAARVVWTVLVAAFLVLAIAAPVEMLQFKSQLDEADPGGDGEARVRMVSLTFAPEVLAVRRGTEVVFENDDVAPHTVTDAAGTFDSGTLNSRKVFKLVVQDAVEYICLIHPHMRGKIVLTG